MMGIKSLPEYFVQQQHSLCRLVFQEVIHQPEIIFIVQHVQVLDDSLISDVPVGEAAHLVEDGKCVSHASIRFLSNDHECFRLRVDAFFLCHIL